MADHVQRVLKPNFAASWDEVGEENQVEETFVLTAMKDIPGERGVACCPGDIPMPCAVCRSGVCCDVSGLCQWNQPLLDRCHNRQYLGHCHSIYKDYRLSACTNEPRALIGVTHMLHRISFYALFRLSAHKKPKGL